jgi:hypothetical protein
MTDVYKACFSSKSKRPEIHLSRWLLDHQTIENNACFPIHMIQELLNLKSQHNFLRSVFIKHFRAEKRAEATSIPNTSNFYYPSDFVSSLIPNSNFLYPRNFLSLRDKVNVYIEETQAEKDNCLR